MPRVGHVPQEQRVPEMDRLVQRQDVREHGQEPGNGVQLGREAQLVEVIEELWVVECEQVIALQEAVRGIAFEASVSDYLLDIVHRTRQTDELRVGVSTRGALSLYRAAQALAMIEGRTFVVPDDVKRLAPLVFSHRVIVKGFLRTGQRDTTDAIVRRIVEQTPVPT